MKIVFVLRHGGVFRYFEGVVRELCRRGHIVDVVTVPSEKTIVYGRSLQLCEAEVENFRVHFRDPFRGIKWSLLTQWREISNYFIYSKPGHPSPALAKRRENYLLTPLRIGLKSRLIRNSIVSKRGQRVLRKFELIFPPDKEVARWLRNNSADVVVASPFIFGSPLEIEYIKAARRLGIPNVVAVSSWDNLTTKGTFSMLPDLVLVWNDAMLKEAAEIHSVPTEKVEVTGAPPFDGYFEMKQKLDYESLCRRVNLDPKKPFILYVSSSRSIAGNEVPFVTEFVRNLRKHEVTKQYSVLVRPHPLNASIWEGFSQEDVSIWPPRGDIPDIPESKQSYYDMLFHSKAVVGVNTSAFLEAAIVDKPCVTILTEHYRHSQSDIGHFHHLLNGDFIEMAAGFPEAAEILANILEGLDIKKVNRRQFVKDFIRPRGIDEQASHVMVSVIEKMAL